MKIAQQDLQNFDLRQQTFLSDPGVPGVRSMGPDLSNSLREYVET